MRPVVMYDSEVITLNRSEGKKSLVIWERKMLRKIFGPVKEGGIWRIRSNHELMDLRRQPDFISEIRKGRLQCDGRLERIPSQRNMKKVFKDIPKGKKSFGKPRKRWLDDVENHMKKSVSG
jgi:ABC-type cobalamin transport system ATPase subunit